jgi:hypothetical protein
MIRLFILLISLASCKEEIKPTVAVQVLKFKAGDMVKVKDSINFWRGCHGIVEEYTHTKHIYAFKLRNVYCSGRSMEAKWFLSEDLEIVED